MYKFVIQGIDRFQRGGLGITGEKKGAALARPRMSNMGLGKNRKAQKHL